MHLIIISELSKVNLFGLGVQKVLLELLFCFVFFLIPDSTRKVEQNTNPSPAACLSASVAAEQRRLMFSRGNNIIIIIIVIL